MAHPDGGGGKYFNPVHTFEQAYEFVGEGGITFLSTTGKRVMAKRGKTHNGIQTIFFRVEKKTDTNNVCPACWGYRINCSEGTIGQFTVALDKQIP